MSDQGGFGNKRLQQTQAQVRMEIWSFLVFCSHPPSSFAHPSQVDEVVGIMRTNVEKVLERDQKLSELDDRADALQQGASQFEQQAGKLKRKYWWKNLKVFVTCNV